MKKCNLQAVDSIAVDIDPQWRQAVADSVAAHIDIGVVYIHATYVTTRLIQLLAVHSKFRGIRS